MVKALEIEFWPPNTYVCIGGDALLICMYMYMHRAPSEQSALDHSLPSLVQGPLSFLPTKLCARPCKCEAVE